jgi:hypothetical protein
MEATASDMCDSVRGEYVLYRTVLENLQDTSNPIWDSTEIRGKHSVLGRAFVATALNLALHPAGTVAINSPTYAAMCTSDGDVHAEAMRLSHDSAFGYCGVQGELFNPLGCNMAHESNPHLDDYPVRFGMLFVANRLLRASLDMRKSAGEGGRGNADVSHSGHSDVVVDPIRGILSIKRSDLRPDESQYLSIPMPASRLH